MIATATALPAAVDDFLAEGSSSSWTSYSTALALVGVVLAAGLVAFALLVLRSGVPRPLVATAGAFAGVGLLGACLEVRDVSRQSDTGWWDALTLDASSAALLRLFGAIGLAVGIAVWHARIDRDRGVPGPAAVALVSGGAIAAWLSFAFDGHSLSRGPEIAHRVASVVHAGAGSIWAGGVIGLAVVAALGRHEHRRTSLVAVLVRFSTVATATLVVVAVVGVAMSVWIVDGPSEYVSTTWGLVLLAKLAVVAVAAWFGAHHHWRLVPAMKASPDDPALAERARRSLRSEAFAVAVVVVLTGLLVGASTV